jgi:hypothetical protein
MFFNWRARVVLGAPISGFPSRLEFAHLNVRPANRETAPLIAQGKHRHLLQSSSASRFTAGASGFLNFSQSGERPDLYREPRRFDTIPSAFDLLELDGLDMRREPIETRKATLASLLRKGKPGVRLNEHMKAAGDMLRI